MEKKNLSEADVLSRIGQIASRKVNNAKDRALATLGSNEATGRLQLRHATEELRKKWGVYLGREKAAGTQINSKSPSIANLVEFLHLEFGIDMNAEWLGYFKKYFHDGTGVPSRPVATSPGAANESLIYEADGNKVDLNKIYFDPNELFPAMANLFLKRGVFSFGDNPNAATGKTPAESPEDTKGETAGFDAAAMKEMLLSGKYITKAQLQWINTMKVREDWLKTMVTTLTTNDTPETTKARSDLAELIAAYLFCYFEALKGDPTKTTDANFDKLRFSRLTKEKKIDKQLEAFLEKEGKDGSKVARQKIQAGLSNGSLSNQSILFLCNTMISVASALK